MWDVSYVKGLFSEIGAWQEITDGRMNKEMKIVRPGLNGTFIAENGDRLIPPEGWEFLPAGDAGITRKVTGKGVFWRVQIKVGRRVISKGVWAPSETIASARQETESIRSTCTYKKRLESDRRRRKEKQSLYEKEFYTEVRDFLSFAPLHKQMEEEIAKAVTDLAIPVGSGTVARTMMISVEERASRAVIAWMRHKTTAYDSMKIPRVKGKRREVRRILAGLSTELLSSYRKGSAISDDCPLKKMFTTSKDSIEECRS